MKPINDAQVNGNMTKDVLINDVVCVDVYFRENLLKGILYTSKQHSKKNTL